MSGNNGLNENADLPSASQQVEAIKVQACPECGSTRLMRDYECAEIVCMDCGFVVAAKIADRGPEWRAFDDEQRSKGCQRPSIGTTAMYMERVYLLGKRLKSIDYENGKEELGFQMQQNETWLLHFLKLQKYPII